MIFVFVFVSHHLYLDFHIDSAPVLVDLLGWRSSTAGSSDLLVGSLRINKDKSNRSNHDLICSAFRGENDDKFKPALPSACEALPCKKKIVRDDAKIGRERR